MFEDFDSGKFLSDTDFSHEAKQLQAKLIREQLAFRQNKRSLVLIIAGPAGAGKGRLSHRLNTWMDPRHIDTHALWDHSDEEDERPWFWRFWRRLPAAGSIGIFLGSWYTELLNASVRNEVEEHYLQTALEQIRAFETLLVRDGYCVVKLWLHISRQGQYLQLSEKAPGDQQNPRTGADPRQSWYAYPRFVDYAERILRFSDTSDAPWEFIASEDHNWRELRAGEALYNAFKAHRRPPQPALPQAVTEPPDAGTRLDSSDLSARLNKAAYQRALEQEQTRLQDLAWQAHRARISLVAVFEGWDAAGKGSTIRRVTAAIDPRLYHLVQIAAPDEQEQRYHYLWRFWRELQRDGRATLFDRSWYGRVLVERVEGLSKAHEWRRAYEEINHFEQHLVEHGSVVMKFWLHISPEEQLRRFVAREKIPHKRHKITEEDWRNRDRWQDYAAAVEDMLALTDTPQAPWQVIPSENKRWARIAVLQALADRLEAALAARGPAPL